ncbi:MAG TPA: right-handed parallel beta-helix repeat-containing protein [Solirubrobacterales bacterium]|nr:right-handed parallel beta-helix repeat-containing protein [Solirubrobacterales bacterium]
MRPSLRLLATLVAAIALLPVAGAAADPFPVTSLANDGSGSLREAIEGANARLGGDTIPIGVSGTIELEEALPTVEDDVAIAGPGASSLTVEPSSGNEFRIFDFGFDITAALSGVTVTGGVAEEGGGIRGVGTDLALIGVVVTGNEAVDVGDEDAFAAGGGVYNSGSLTVRESRISDNSAAAIGGNQLSTVLGGGVMAWGALTIDRSTISGNAAEAHGEAGRHTGALGGGLRVFGEPAVVERSTISGNSVLAEGGLTNEARGGGLQSNELSLTSSTVTGNSLYSIGAATGANIYSEYEVLIRNTIIANAGGGSSCSTADFALTSGGFNLDEDGSCGLGASTDQAGLVAGLDPVLRENGGPTPTHALLPGSIAIDRGNSFGSTSDQRGFPRPVDFPTRSNSEGGDGGDIGAFELQPPAQTSQPPSAPPLRVTQVPGDRTPPQTRIVSGPARAGFERLAEFRFTATEPQSRFQCKVDKRRWRGCASPFRRRVGAGRGAGRKHVFKVRAVDRFGNSDPTPARFGWRVKKVVG